MTKILRQISPEIFDQIYSLANKQNTLSWQIIFLGAAAACLPPAPPSEALCGSRAARAGGGRGAGAGGCTPQLQWPRAGRGSGCWLLLLLSEWRLSLPLCFVMVQRADPVAVILTNKKYTLRLVKRWVLYREEMMWSLFNCQQGVLWF